MITVTYLFLVGALIAAIVSAVRPGIPLWIAFILLWVVVALGVIPVK